MNDQQPQQQPDGSTWIVIGVIVLLLMLRSGGCSLGGSPPPFSADKPSVMVSADLSVAGDQSLGKTHPGVISAVTAWSKANGAEYWLDDTNQNTPPTNEAQWVQDAWKAADRAHPPSIVGASKTRGIRPQSLPNTPASATTLLDTLK